MNLLLRCLSLAVGSVLCLAPLFLLLFFSYAVGEQPSSSTKDFNYFVLPLVAGVALGGGLVLVGLPTLVVGQRRPAFQFSAAVMLGISALAIVYLGFSGSVTAVASPLALLVEAVAFYHFVYPAKHFASTHRKSVVSANDA